MKNLSKTIAATFSFFQFFQCLFCFNICQAQWVQMSVPNASEVHCIEIYGDQLFVGTNNGIFHSNNNGANWESAGLTNHRIISLAKSGNNLLAGSWNYEGIFLSTNNGENWIAAGLSGRAILDLETISNNVFAGTDSGFFLSTNNGGNWAASGLPNQYILSLAKSGNNLLAGTNEDLYLSSNNGANWQYIFLIPFHIQVVSFAVSGDTVYASGIPQVGGTALIFYSYNSGIYFPNIIGPLPNNLYAGSLAMSGINIFAGTFEGIFMTSNSGVNWINKNQGFNSPPSLSCLTIGNGYIFAGTYGQSAWKRSIMDITSGIEQISGFVPSSFSLKQNYPNPFNPETKIRYDVSSSCDVKLKVFDMNGREVETLVNEKQSPGTYEATFNASSFPSGVYFYEMHAGKFTETKKMIVIK